MEVLQANDLIEASQLFPAATVISSSDKEWEIEVKLNEEQSQRHADAKSIALCWTAESKLIAHFKSEFNCESAECNNREFVIKTVEITDTTPSGVDSYLESL